MEEKIEKESSNKKSGNKKFFIIYILALIIITAISIFITIRYIDKNNSASPLVESSYVDNKVKAEDAKFALNSYSETYNENDLVIKEYIDNNGKIVENNFEEGITDGQRKSFIQIEGLKDKNIQDIVNNKLKDTAYGMGSNLAIESNITANFSNIISVTITSYENHNFKENKVLNIDLNTGEEIPFEKVFVSSASVNSILSEGLYKILAWDVRSQNTNQDNWEDDFDISKYDISDFESKEMILAKRYEKLNGNIKYSISFSGLIIYDLLDGLTQNSYINTLSIDFVDHLEDVAIFKRYVTQDSIFERSDLGMKNMIVCECSIPYALKMMNMCTTLNLGFVSDNVYMEDYLQASSLDSNVKSNIIKHLKNISDETKKSITANSNEGIFYQRYFNVYYDSYDNAYRIQSNCVTTKCDLTYFKNDAFRDYIKSKIRKSADASILFFEKYDLYNEYPELNVKDTNDEKELVFDENGKYIGIAGEIYSAIAGDTDTTVEENNTELHDEVSNETAGNNTSNNINNAINNVVETNEVENSMNNIANISNTIDNTIVENN